MKITGKKVSYYKKGFADVPDNAFVSNYTIKIPDGYLTYRVAPFWTCIIRANGTVHFVGKTIPLNEDNPQESIDKFESLLVLK
jgi:hypothetical protein